MSPFEIDPYAAQPAAVKARPADKKALSKAPAGGSPDLADPQDTVSVGRTDLPSVSIPPDIPQYLRELIEKAEDYYKEGNLAGAADHYYQASLAARKQGNEVLARQLLSNAAACMDKYALMELEKGTRSSYFLAEDLFYAAKFYLELGEGEGAKALYKLAAECYLKAAEDSGRFSFYRAESYDRAAVALAFVCGEETPEVAKYKEKALFYYKKDGGDRASVRAGTLPDRLWAASKRYFLEDGMPFVEDLLEGDLFSGLEELEDLTENADSGYRELQDVLAKLNMRLARNYLGRGMREWAAFYLEKVALCLARAGRTEAAERMYAQAAKMWLKAREDAVYLKSKVDSLLSASQAFEKAGDHQGEIDAQRAAAEVLIREASYAESTHPPRYAEASLHLRRAVLLLEKCGSKEEVALQKENLKRVNELAADQFRALQERRTAEIDGLGYSAAGSEIALSHADLFTDLDRQAFEGLGFKGQVFPYGSKLDAHTAAGLEVLLEGEVRSIVDPFLYAYYEVLKKQCEVVEEMAVVMKKAVSFPPTQEEVVAYAKALAASGKDANEIGAAFHRYAEAFFVHTWDVKGCGDNIGKPRSWADVTAKRDYSPDGRWVIDCEGFAYLAITFFKAAGYQVIGGDMMAAGKKDDAHAFSVLRHSKSGKMVYTSNADVFYTRAEIEQELTEMDLAGVEETLDKLPAGR